MNFEKYNQRRHSETTPPLDLIARKLHDHVSTENKITQTILTENGIRDLPAFITFDTTFDASAKPLADTFVNAKEQMQESTMPTDDLAIDAEPVESPITSPENKDVLCTFTATSQEHVIDEMCNYYMKNALKAAKKTLTQKNIPKDRIPQMAQQIVTGIAQKKVDAFYEAQIQLLIEQSLSEKDAQDYYTWRINNVDEAVSFFLKTDTEHAHILSATNFIDDHFISLFLQERSIKDNVSDQNAPNMSPSTQEPSFHTSAHIDAMLDELQNL